MKNPPQDPKEYYKSLETEDLVERYKLAGIRGFERAILAQIIRERGLSPEKIPKPSSKEKEAETVKEYVPPSFSDLNDYRKHYESVDTEFLLKYRQKSKSNKFALSVIDQVLKERGFSQKNQNALALKETSRGDQPKQDDRFAFGIKAINAPSLKAIVISSLFSVFGAAAICGVMGFFIGLIGAIIGISVDKLKLFIILVIAPGVSFLFCVIMSIFLVKRYNDYFFPGSWKINISSRIKTGLKWSIPFIVVFSLAGLDPSTHTDWVNYYLLVNKLSLENVTIIVVILISLGYLVATFLEELVFRGMIQQYIMKFVTPRISVLVTACLFTIAHFGHFFIVPVSLDHIVGWFVGGLFFGFAFNKYNSCISSFIPHLVFNLRYIIVVPLLLTF